MSRRTASLIPRSGAKPRVSKDGPEVRSGPAGSRDKLGQSFEAPSGRLRTTEALAADGLPRLSEVVAAHGLEPRKALGQNFLFDLNLTRKIARAGGPARGRRRGRNRPRSRRPHPRAALGRGGEGDRGRARRPRARRARRDRRALAGAPRNHRGRRASRHARRRWSRKPAAPRSASSPTCLTTSRPRS